MNLSNSTVYVGPSLAKLLRKRDKNSHAIVPQEYILKIKRSIREYEHIVINLSTSVIFLRVCLSHFGYVKKRHDLSFTVHPELHGSLQQVLVALLHQSMFVAGVSNPGWKGNLGKNHPSLLAAGVSDLGRRGDLYAKMSHITQKSPKRVQKSHYSRLSNRTYLPEGKNQQLGEPAVQLRQ